MRHTEIIQKIINKTGAKIYLEIGAASGKNFLRIKAPKKFGIDPKNKIHLVARFFNFSNFFTSRFFEMTSDDFFKKHANRLLKNKIGVAFIDGHHTHEQSLKDVKNCLQYLKENGIIVMHDCNPPTEEMASPKPTGRAWNGDVWKTIAYLRTQKDLAVFVLDTDWGIGIVTHGNPENNLALEESDIEKMTYRDLEKNRKEFLNLKTEDYLFTFLGK